MVHLRWFFRNICLKNPYGASIRVVRGVPHIRNEGATCNNSPVCILISLVEFMYLNPSFVWCTVASRHFYKVGQKLFFKILPGALRNHLSDKSLSHLMKIAIESPDKLQDTDLKKLSICEPHYF